MPINVESAGPPKRHRLAASFSQLKMRAKRCYFCKILQRRFEEIGRERAYPASPHPPGPIFYEFRVQNNELGENISTAGYHPVVLHVEAPRNRFNWFQFNAYTFSGRLLPIP